ncbi:MAG: CHAT domain-containing protein [Pseudomonadota bacterium]
MKQFVFWLFLSVLASVPGRADTNAELMEEAFQAAQLVFLSSAGSAIRQTAHRQASGDGPAADLLRRRQTLENRLASVEAELASLGRPEEEDGRARATRLGGEISSLRVEIETLDAKIDETAPEARRLTSPAIFTIGQVQAKLAADEALIFFFVGESDTYTWAITPTDAAWTRVGLGRAALANEITEIRKSLGFAGTLRAAVPLDDVDNRGPRVPAFDRTRAFLLYWELLGQLEPFLADKRHLFVVPDGPLTGIPLSLLITDAQLSGEDTDPEALRSTSWFFQRHALTTLPSVESLSIIRSASANRSQDQSIAFLGFGDPAFSGSARPTSTSAVTRAGTSDPDSIRALAPLPGTRRELTRIAETLGPSRSELFLGPDASERAVKTAALSDARIIAFATHGLLSGDLPGLTEPALVFSPPETPEPGNDGLLTASEIAELSLDADWVLLSACNTAGGDGRPDAEGLSGLARAFLFAGARSILVSHWPVRDDAATRLTTDSFKAMAEDPERRKAEALQQAMQALLSDPSDPTLAHPAAWAPFVLVGEGG